MKENKLYKAIGQIEEDFIMEAKDSTQKVKKLHFKKIVVIAIAATMMLGIGTWAANSIITGRGSSSSILAEFKSLPSAKEVETIIGKPVQLPEQFANGYKFDSAHKLSNSNYGEDLKVVEKFGSMVAYYKKGNDKVSLSIDPLNLGSELNYGDLVETYKDCELYYTAYTAKMVPGDYEMTEEDKKDEASGKYVFSYGSDEVYTMEIQGLTWKRAGGVDYNFTVMDSELTKQDLVTMAKELIDKN